MVELYRVWIFKFKLCWGNDINSYLTIMVIFRGGMASIQLLASDMRCRLYQCVCELWLAKYDIILRNIIELKNKEQINGI